MSQPSDFEAATRAELLRLSAEARKLCPGHICPDKAPCRHCAAYRRKHAEIDDHLDQLFGVVTLTRQQVAALQVASRESVAVNTRAPNCTCCEAGRFRHVVNGAWLFCTDCDRPTLPSLGFVEPDVERGAE